MYNDLLQCEKTQCSSAAAAHPGNHSMMMLYMHRIATS